jgi:hypothetical protein
MNELLVHIVLDVNNEGSDEPRKGKTSDFLGFFGDFVF